MTESMTRIGAGRARRRVQWDGAGARSREPRAESREPRAESREPRAESREPGRGVGSRGEEPGAESREPGAEGSIGSYNSSGEANMPDVPNLEGRSM